MSCLSLGGEKLVWWLVGLMLELVLGLGLRWRLRVRLWLISVLLKCAAVWRLVEGGLLLRNLGCRVSGIGW